MLWTGNELFDLITIYYFNNITLSPFADYSTSHALKSGVGHAFLRRWLLQNHDTLVLLELLQELRYRRTIARFLDKLETTFRPESS